MATVAGPRRRRRTAIFDGAGSLPGSRRSRLIAGTLSRTIRPLVARTTISAVAIRHTRAVLDQGALLFGPLVRGTTVQRVLLPHARAELVRAPGARQDDRVILYCHGGGFVLGTARLWRPLASRLSAMARMPVLSVDYRLVPEYTVAEAVDDAVDAYKSLLDKGYRGVDVVLAGDSAGASLAFSVALRARDEGLPTPGGIAAMSPWVDLASSGESYRTNLTVDPYMPIEAVTAVAALCAADGDLDGAELSPLYADPAGLPPVLIQVGERELLRSDGEELARRLTEAGVHCGLQVWQGQMHAFPVFPALPESRAALRHIARFAADPRTVESG